MLELVEFKSGIVFRHTHEFDPIVGAADASNLGMDLSFSPDSQLITVSDKMGGPQYSGILDIKTGRWLISASWGYVRQNDAAFGEGESLAGSLNSLFLVDSKRLPRPGRCAWN